MRRIAGTMLITGLMGVTSQQAHLLAMTEEHCLATNQQGASKKADDESSPLSAESVERLKELGAGRSQIMPAREDVRLVIRAMQDQDPTVSSHACLALEKIAPYKLFKPEDMKALWDGLRPKLRSQHDDTSEWSARGVGALARDTELLAGVFLAEAFDETILMVMSEAPEMRRRGAALSSDLVKRLPRDSTEKLIRSLLAISPVAVAGDSKMDDAEARCKGMVAHAICFSASRIETESLANEVAARLLGLCRENTVPSGAELRIIGLAQLAATTNKETRQQIVDAVLAAAADRRWAYSVTSGVLSPPKHAGAEALVILAPSLTREELETAEHAIPVLAPGEKQEWYDSMYAAAKESLAVRRLGLRQ